MNKKTKKLIVGVFALLFGMGLNLQYALGDYGLAGNSLVRQVLAASTGADEGGTGGVVDDSKPCENCNKAGGPGAQSCECIAASITIAGVTIQGTSCSASVFPGYYACCRLDTNGLCKCPSCKG